MVIKLFVLTLAAIARELDGKGMNRATVHIAAGLPLTWVLQGALPHRLRSHPRTEQLQFLSCRLYWER